MGKSPQPGSPQSSCAGHSPLHTQGPMGSEEVRLEAFAMGSLPAQSVGREQPVCL